MIAPSTYPVCRNLLLGLSLAIAFAQAVSAQSATLDGVLGPHIACSGTTEWQASGDDVTARSESWRLAVSADGARIVLFPDGSEPMAEDVWPCASGFCTAARVLETAVSTSVVRLTADGAGYRLAVAFTVVSPDGAGLQAEHVLGSGVLACDSALPAGVLAPASQ